MTKSNIILQITQVCYSVRSTTHLEVRDPPGVDVLPRRCIMGPTVLSRVMRLLTAELIFLGVKLGSELD